MTTSRIGIICALSMVIAGCDGQLSGDDAGRADVPSVPRDTPAIDAPGADVPETDEDTGVPVDAPLGLGCEGRDYLLCEDFEGADPGELPAGWTVGGGWQSEDSNPEVSSDEARSGSRSLRSSIGVHGQRRAERSIESLGESRGEHWGRIFYRVSEPFFAPGGGVVHNTMVALLGGDESRVVDTVIAPSGMHQFLYNLPDDSCCAGSSYDFEYEDAWHCAEWHVDAENQAFQFFYDGAEVDDLTFTGRAGARMDAFASIAVGWRNYQDATTPYVSYFDDLALDEERIGCE